MKITLEQGLGWGFIILGAATIYGSLGLTYTTEYGPGAGFFPRWLGIGIVVLAIPSVVKPSASSSKSPTGQLLTAWGKPFKLIVGLAATYLLAPILGLLLTIALLVTWVFYRLEHIHFFKSLLMGAATSLVIYLVFEVWLGVPPLVGMLGI